MKIQPIYHWFWKHKGRVLVMLLYFFLSGAAVSILYAGFLNGNSPLLAAILGTVGGLLLSSLWIWQMRAAERGQVQRARRMTWTFVLVPVLAVLAFALTSFGQLYALGRYQPLEKDYAANFDRLAWAVENNYPYFEIKHVNWAETVARYRPRVAAAKTDGEYHAAVADLLAELQDGHTGLNYVGVSRFGTLEDIEGQAVVTLIGAAGKAAGMQVGDVVHSVGGLGIDQAVEALPAPLRMGPTPGNRRRNALANLLRVPPEGKLEVQFTDASGQEHVVTLVPSQQPAPAASNASQPEPVITARSLPSGLGLIKVSQLWGSGDLIAEFDRALNGLMDAPGIILDLRGNGGGDSMIGDAIAGRFLAQPLIYGTEYYRRSLPFRFWRTQGTYSVQPREPVYTGPLAVITDAGVFSSGEQLVAALKDSGRAVTVGQVTGGGSGNPVSFKLLGGRSARFSTGAFYRNNGELIEGRGIAPNVPVAQTLEAFRAGEDLFLAAAEKYLSGQ